MLHSLKLLLLNEYRRMRHDRTPMAALFALCLLLVVSGANTWQQWQGRAEALAEANRQSMHDWQSQPDRHPHRVAHFGDFASRPLHPLSLVEPGILDQAGHLVYLEAHRLNSANFNPASEATGLGRFQAITPALVVQWFMPLVIIMLGYATVTREKAAGTLCFITANGTSPSLVALAKWLALFLPLAALLLFMHAIIASFVLDSPQGYQRLLLMAGAQLLYLGLWCALVVLCSWLARHMHASLLALLLIWVCVCIVIPRGLANIAQSRFPTYPRTEAEYLAEKKLKQIGDSHNPNDPYFDQFKSRILKQYGVSTISELPVNYNGLVMQEGERLTTGVYREQLSRQLQQMQRQTDWIRQWSWLSPALALQYAQMASAGNDLAHHRDFLQQAEERRYKLIQYLNSLHTYRIHQHDDKNQRIDASFWLAAPRPVIHPAPVQVSQSQIAASLLTLLGWIGLTLLVLRRTLHHHET